MLAVLLLENSADYAKNYASTIGKSLLVTLIALNTRDLSKIVML